MGKAIVVVVLLFMTISMTCILGLNSRSTTAAHKRVRTCIRGKEADKEEQWRIQQEILRRRRDPKAKALAEAKVESRRVEASKQVGRNFWNKRVKSDNEDPLDQWKEAKKRGEVKDFGYPEEPPKESSLFGLNIPIPSSPIDVPKYDNGERFDLRLPYAERGYVDDDADVMGKISKFFGFGKKGTSKRSDDE